MLGVNETNFEEARQGLGQLEGSLDLWSHSTSLVCLQWFQKLLQYQ